MSGSASSPWYTWITNPMGITNGGGFMGWTKQLGGTLFLWAMLLGGGYLAVTKLGYCSGKSDDTTSPDQVKPQISPITTPPVTTPPQVENPIKKKGDPEDKAQCVVYTKEGKKKQTKEKKDMKKAWSKFTNAERAAYRQHGMGGSSAWTWIIVVVLFLAAGGAVYFFMFMNKSEDEDEELV